jgi:ATP-dependent protease ClpP protease subunit
LQTAKVFQNFASLLLSRASVMNKKIKRIILNLSLIVVSGCADTYNINPVANQRIFIHSNPEDTHSASQQKPIAPNNSAKTTAIINFIGKVTLKKTNDLTSFIHKQLSEGVQDFIININSNGGDSDAGISAYQYLKQLPVAISTYNTGNVQSSAALIYCSGTKRYALPHAFFMLHGSSTRYAEGMSFVEIAALGKLSTIHRQAFVDIFMKCTDVETPQLESYFSSADAQYFTAAEAQKIGLVQEIAAPPFAKALTFYNITD